MDGKMLPPHKDWMKNVFLPSCERSLNKAHKSLESVTLVGERAATTRGTNLAKPRRLAETFGENHPSIALLMAA